MFLRQLPGTNQLEYSFHKEYSPVAGRLGDDRSQRPFKKLKRTFAKGRRFSRGGDRTGGDRRGGRKGDQRPKALEDVECYNCGEKGHYANKCPKPKRSDSKGGGRGGGKRGGGGGRGGGKKPRSDVAEPKA